MRPDPEVWQEVPPLAEAADWYGRRVALAPEAARDSVATASALAIRARTRTELSTVLLLCDPAAELYAMLGIAALDGVPAPSTAAGAVGIAETLVPSTWPGQAVPFDLDGVAGWRITLLDEDAVGGDEQVALPQTVSTVYVTDVRGRCVVASLSSLPPLAAAVAQTLVEQVVSTFDIDDGAR